MGRRPATLEHTVADLSRAVSNLGNELVGMRAEFSQVMNTLVARQGLQGKDDARAKILLAGREKLVEKARTNFMIVTAKRRARIELEITAMEAETGLVLTDGEREAIMTKVVSSLAGAKGLTGPGIDGGGDRDGFNDAAGDEDETQAPMGASLLKDIPPLLRDIPPLVRAAPLHQGMGHAPQGGAHAPQGSGASAHQWVGCAHQGGRHAPQGSGASARQGGAHAHYSRGPVY
eukprot:jgi/Mesvir1/3760/Mv15034-RA.1